MITEHFSIEPASWNRPGEPWTFHLNVGVSYFDIPARLKGLIPGTHAATRYATVTTTLINPDDADRGKMVAQAEQVAEIILTASKLLMDQKEILRRSYDRGELQKGFTLDPDASGGEKKLIHLT